MTTKKHTVKTPWGIHAAAFTLLASAAAVVSAQEAALGAVTVSASRSEVRLEEIPLHTTVVSREAIDNSPAQSLDQLLRDVPGLNMSALPAAISDPTGQQTKMRGMGNAKVLVLLDGVPIVDPFYLTTQWYKVPLSTVERVEIIRGGISSLWGNMATAGVINIISRRPKEAGGELLASVGTQGTSNLALSKSFVASEQLSFSLNLDNYRTEGYQTTPAEHMWRFPQKKAPRANDSNFQLSAFFKPSADLSGYLRLGYHIQDQDLGYRYSNNLQQSPDLAAGFTRNLGADSSLSGNAWAQYVRFEKYNGATCYWQGASCPTSAAVTPAQVNGNVVQFYNQYGSQRYREQGGSLTWSRNFKSQRTSIQSGIDYRHLSATDRERFYSQPTSPTSPQGTYSSSEGEGQQTFYGLFGQARYFPLDELELTFSGRVDRWQNTDRIVTRTNTAGVVSGGAMPDSTKTSFNPSIAARFELSETVALRGAAYKAFRAPGFNNTTRTYGNTTPTIANPDLAPESLTGWEAGADARLGQGSLGLTYFRYRITDMIATFRVNSYATAPALVRSICASGGANLNNCGGSANFYTNDQDGESHGIELTGHWNVNADLNFDASYTHTETYLTRRGSVVTDPLGVQLTAVPRNVAQFGAVWKPTSRLRTYGEVRYTGPMLTDTTSNNSTMRAGQGGVTVFSAGVAYAWDAATELFVSAVNLFDKRYSENAYAVAQSYNRVWSSPLAINAGVKVRF